MSAWILADSWISPSLLHPGISIFEKVLRPVVVYVFLVFLLRVFGKRELAQLNPFDLVVLLSLSNTVQNAIIGPDDSLVGGLVGALALCSVNYFVVRFLFRHRRLDQIVEGRPTVLIQDGVVIKEALRKELLTKSELLTMAHRQGFTHLADIRRCVLEPGGSFFMEGKEPARDELRHSELRDRLDRLELLTRELHQAVVDVRRDSGR